MSIFSNSMISQALRSSLTRNPMQGSMVNQGLQSSITRDTMQNSIVGAGLRNDWTKENPFDPNQRENEEARKKNVGVNNDTLNVLRSALGAAIDYYSSGLNEGNLSESKQQPYARSFLPTGLFSQER